MVNYVNTNWGPLAVDDPDPEQFIDMLSSGLSVADVLRLRDEDSVRDPPSRRFWAVIVQRIWDLLEANSEYDQNIFDGFIAQGEQRQKTKTKKWKQRAKAYRAALTNAGISAPLEVADDDGV